MNLRQANTEAVSRFGAGSYCESTRDRRTLGVPADVVGRRFVFDYAPGTSWRLILDGVADPAHVQFSKSQFTAPSGAVAT